MKYSLESIVRIQDALDAMDDTSCITRAEFVNCNKPEARLLYAEAWDEAKAIISSHGTLAKAAAHVEKVIQSLTEES